jgi:hypothetical protein
MEAVSEKQNAAYLPRLPQFTTGQWVSAVGNVFATMPNELIRIFAEYCGTTHVEFSFSKEPSIFYALTNAAIRLMCEREIYTIFDRKEAESHRERRTVQPAFLVPISSRDRYSSGICFDWAGVDKTCAKWEKTVLQRREEAHQYKVFKTGGIETFEEVFRYNLAHCLRETSRVLRASQREWIDRAIASAVIQYGYEHDIEVRPCSEWVGFSDKTVGAGATSVLAIFIAILAVTLTNDSEQTWLPLHMHMSTFSHNKLMGEIVCRYGHFVNNSAWWYSGARGQTASTPLYIVDGV